MKRPWNRASLASIQDVDSCGVGRVAKWTCLAYSISPVVQVERCRGDSQNLLGGGMRADQQVDRSKYGSRYET